MDASTRNYYTMVDPTSVLDFFDSLGVFADLNGPRNSLFTSYGHQRGTPTHMDGPEAQSSFGHERSPRGHFSGSFGAGYGASLVRTASPVLYDTRHQEDQSDPFSPSHTGVQFEAACSLEESNSTPPPTRAEREDDGEDGGDNQSPGKKQKTTMTTTTTTTTKKKKKKPSGQRQREELTHLRNTVAELKDKLHTLKHETRMALCANTDTVPSPAALWLELAQRQQEARERAEAENAELKVQVDAQLKFAKTLERAMQKRKLLSSLKDDQQRWCKVVATEDAAIFATLKSSVDARASHLDEIFSAQGLTEDSPGQRSEAKWTMDEENRLRVDFVSCKAALFDVPTIAKAVWGRIALADLRADNCVGLVTEVVDDSPDVKLIKQSAVISATPSDSGSESSSDGECEEHVTVVRIVCRRITEDRRVRFVWETQTEPRGAVLRGMPPLQMTEQGCGRVFESSVSPESRKRTMLQSTVSVIPKLSGASSAELQASSAKELAQLIIASYEANAESARRVIENQLMDQLTATAAATNARGVDETEGTTVGLRMKE